MLKYKLQSVEACLHFLATQVDKRYKQGSYRKPEVLHVLEFYDFIRVPLNLY